MPNGNYSIFQGQILNKDEVNPRQYTVMQIPEGYNMVGVQLPNALKDQSAPLIGSIVLVLQLEDYSAYIISVLREPFDFLTANQQYAGFIPSTGDPTLDIANHSNSILDGEIFMESTGPLSPTGQLIPGFGASLFLGNNGVAKISSGSMGEKLIVGGTSADDDHEVILTGNNGFFESNPHPILNTQSSFNFTRNILTGIDEGLSVATQIALPTGLPSVVPPIPICELKMTPLGYLSLGNTIVGTGISQCSLTMLPVGICSLQVIGAGFTSIADITLSGTGTIDINFGTLGAARITDSTTSALVVDPIYWKFINAIQGFFTALSGFQGGSPVLQSQLGALGTAFLAQSPIAPPSLTSKISSGSTSVFIGG
jgi:hypothetical protein